MKKSHHLNGNGHSKKSPINIENTEQQIQFPVSYPMKAIFLLPEKKGFYLDEMNRLFVSLTIENKLMNEKVSKKGNYISFTFLVHLNSKEQMHRMYGAMKEIDGLKFAL